MTGFTLCGLNVVKTRVSNFYSSSYLCGKMLRSSVYKPTKKRNLPLTYEMANPAYQIGVRKTWNSMNTSNLWEGTRRYESAWEDFLIRRFMKGMFPKLVSSEVIIKRQFNTIRVGCLLTRFIMPRKLYFLVGFSEEMLSNMLKCSVKIEIQTIVIMVTFSKIDEERIEHAAAGLGVCLSSLKSAVDHYTLLAKDNNDWILSARFRPTTEDMVIGNKESASFVKSWLQDWARRPPVELKANGTPRSKKRKVRIEDSDSDFIPDSDDQSDDENGSNKALLLVGPCGSGKTSLVYTLCQELGFKVVEINPSSVRSGKVITEQFKAATGLHRVDANSLLRESLFNAEHKVSKSDKSDTKEKLKQNGENVAKSGNTLTKAFQKLFGGGKKASKDVSKVPEVDTAKQPANKASSAKTKPGPLDSWIGRQKSTPSESLVPEMKESTTKRKPANKDHVLPSVNATAGVKRKSSNLDNVILVESDDNDPVVESVLIEDSDSDEDFQVKRRKKKSSSKNQKSLQTKASLEDSDVEFPSSRRIKRSGGLALERKTLYLIDEVDVTFADSDVGFAQALCRLIASGEKPFILTATSCQGIDRNLLLFCTEVEMARPSEAELCEHLFAIAFSLGNKQVSTSKIEQIVKSSKCDMRLALNSLHFYLDSSEEATPAETMPGHLPDKSIVSNLMLRSELDMLLTEVDMRWDVNGATLKDTMSDETSRGYQNMINHQEELQQSAGKTLSYLTGEFAAMYGTSRKDAGPTMPTNVNICACLDQLMLGKREGFAEHLLSGVEHPCRYFHDRNRMQRFADCASAMRDICRSEVQRKLTCNDRQRRRFFHYLNDCGVFNTEAGIKCLMPQ